MAKRNKLTEEEIVAELRQEALQAIGAHDGELADDIERSFNYYMGKPYGDEVDGRSKFVTREVLETIEGMMPYLVKIFFSSDQAVVFEPDSEEDIPATEQETEYVNWVFYRRNPGFKIGYQWIKDGLMNRIGIVKAVREGSFGPTIRKYRNLTEEQIAELFADIDEDQLENAEIDYDEETGLSDVEIRVDESENNTVIYNIPPENFRISDSARDVKSARYVAEHYQKSISELREMGFEVDDDISDGATQDEFGTVKTSRHSDVDEFFVLDDGSARVGPSREVTVWEEYIFLDANGDGYAELLKVIRVGDTILEQETVEERPYYAWGPIMIPHKFHGLSIADLVMDVQRLKSRLWRNILDNQFLTNNGRYAVVDGQVNLDDLLTSTPHGVVRENFAGAVRELPTPQLGPAAFEVLNYTDSLQERRAGVSERSAGLDPKQFNSNTAMGTTEMVMAAAEQKVELVARLFAETGLKELMLGIHRLGLKFEEPGKKIRASNGEFVAINPDEWKERYDMTVTVGIGNGSKTQQAMQMQQLEDTQQAIIQGGGLGTIVKPSDVFNLAIEKAKVLGRKDASRYFSKPETDEIPNEPSPEEQAKLISAQVEQQRAQMEAQSQQQKLEIDAAKQQLEEEKLEFEKERLEFEIRRHRDENEFRLMETQLELEQERPVLIGKERGSF